MTLAERLREYVAACTTGLWIESHEHEDAITEIAGMCRDENWKLATWDIAGGLSEPPRVKLQPCLCCATD